jgi:hypothetical protein
MCYAVASQLGPECEASRPVAANALNGRLLALEWYMGWFYDGAERRLSRDGLDYLRRCPRSGLDEEGICACPRLSFAVDQFLRVAQDKLLRSGHGWSQRSGPDLAADGGASVGRRLAIAFGLRVLYIWGQAQFYGSSGWHSAVFGELCAYRGVCGRWEGALA